MKKNNSINFPNNIYNFISIHNCIKLLLIVTPFFSIIGNAALNISIVLILFLFLALSIKEKLNRYWFNKASLIFLIFYINMIISSLTSDFQVESLKSSLLYFRFWPVVIAFWYFSNTDKKFNYLFFCSLFLAFIILTVDGLTQYLNEYNLLGFEKNFNRVGGLFNDELILGSYLTRLMPVLFAFLFLFYDNKPKIFALFLTFIITVDITIFISGERTAFSLLFYATILIILLSSQYKILRLITFLVSVILIIYISINDNIVKERVITNTIESIGIDTLISNDNTNDNTNDISIGNKEINIYFFSKQHHNFMNIAIASFSDNWLLGTGPKTFKYICKKDEYRHKIIPVDGNANDGCSTHPHNLYLQVSSETGIIGLIIVSLLFIYIIKIFSIQLYQVTINRKIYFTDYQICLIIAISVSLWPIAPSYNVFGTWISYIYFLPVGFLLSSINYGNLKNP